MNSVTKPYYLTIMGQQASRRTVRTVKWDEMYSEVELEVELLVVIDWKKKQQNLKRTKQQILKTQGDLC